jgi:hypothetical protein
LIKTPEKEQERHHHQTINNLLIENDKPRSYDKEQTE